jgi:uncharacterized cupredoxin-like copper-binding protein
MLRHLTRTTSRLLLASIAVLAAGLLLACSSSDDEATATATSADGTATASSGSEGDQTDVAATLADFTITLDTDTAAAGQVHFSAKNDGPSPHELVIIRSDAAPDGLEVTDGVVDEESVDFVGEIEEFPAGEDRTAAFNLDAGKYILICNIAGHYQLGMHVAFTVN